ncbi:hypothetical protein [Nocardia suismassiliense]|uniref:hypothetical protein n=1 Tax=Nocardia suismassiliense TaxID=2077092 RepID=UPI000D1E74CF|nr:hypothetical protein [Nocardia suismassiliense]
MTDPVKGSRFGDVELEAAEPELTREQFRSELLTLHAKLLASPDPFDRERRRRFWFEVGEQIARLDDVLTAGAVLDDLGQIRRAKAVLQVLRHGATATDPWTVVTDSALDPADWLRSQSVRPPLAGSDYAFDSAMDLIDAVYELSDQVTGFRHASPEAELAEEPSILALGRQILANLDNPQVVLHDEAAQRIRVAITMMLDGGESRFLWERISVNDTDPDLFTHWRRHTLDYRSSDWVTATGGPERFPDMPWLSKVPDYHRPPLKSRDEFDVALIDLVEHLRVIAPAEADGALSAAQRYWDVRFVDLVGSIAATMRQHDRFLSAITVAHGERMLAVLYQQEWPGLHPGEVADIVGDPIEFEDWRVTRNRRLADSAVLQRSLFDSLMSHGRYPGDVDAVSPLRSRGQLGGYLTRMARKAFFTPNGPEFDHLARIVLRTARTDLFTPTETAQIEASVAMLGMRKELTLGDGTPPAEIAIRSTLFQRYVDRGDQTTQRLDEQFRRLAPGLAPYRPFAQDHTYPLLSRHAVIAAVDTLAVLHRAHDYLEPAEFNRTFRSLAESAVFTLGHDNQFAEHERTGLEIAIAASAAGEMLPLAYASDLGLNPSVLAVWQMARELATSPTADRSNHREPALVAGLTAATLGRAGASAEMAHRDTSIEVTPAIELTPASPDLAP